MIVIWHEYIRMKQVYSASREGCCVNIYPLYYGFVNVCLITVVYKLSLSSLWPAGNRHSSKYDKKNSKQGEYIKKRMVCF